MNFLSRKSFNSEFWFAGVSLRISGSQVQLIPHQGGVKAVTNQDGVQRGLPVQLVQTSTGRHIYFPLQSQSGSNTVISANGQRITLAKASTADVKLVNSSSNSNSSITKPVNWTSNVNQVIFKKKIYLVL